MPGNPFTFLDDFSANLSRAQSLAIQIQTIALEADTSSAGDDLNMIDAISDALAGRLEKMVAEAEEAHTKLSEAHLHLGGLSDALGRRTPDSH